MLVIKRNFTTLVVLITVIIFGILAGIIGGGLHNSKSTENTQITCQEYVVIPERYINKVPDSCITHYFAERDKLREAEKERRKQLLIEAQRQ